MTRGNQRDTDRARAAKRTEGKGVPAKEKDGLTAEQRRERWALYGQQPASRLQLLRQSDLTTLPKCRERPVAHRLLVQGRQGDAGEDCKEASSSSSSVWQMTPGLLSWLMRRPVPVALHHVISLCRCNRL